MNVVTTPIVVAYSVAGSSKFGATPVGGGAAGTVCKLTLPAFDMSHSIETNSYRKAGYWATKQNVVLRGAGMLSTTRQRSVVSTSQLALGEIDIRAASPQPLILDIKRLTGGYARAIGSSPQTASAFSQCCCSDTKVIPFLPSLNHRLATQHWIICTRRLWSNLRTICGNFARKWLRHSSRTSYSILPMSNIGCPSTLTSPIRNAASLPWPSHDLGRRQKCPSSSNQFSSFGRKST